MLASLWRNYRTTFVVSVIALLAFASPTLAQGLQLDFAAVASGQWWRIWSGHLTHYGAQHLFWDLLMFVVLGAACERQYPRQFAPAIFVMIAGISVVIAVFCGEIAVYRGLSGLDTGLFVWFIADQCRHCWRDGDRRAAALWLAPGVALAGKLLFEATSGQILFVDSATFQPLVESHLSGAALGFICAGAMRWVQRPGSEPGLMKIRYPPISKRPGGAVARSTVVVAFDQIGRRPGHRADPLPPLRG